MSVLLTYQVGMNVLANLAVGAVASGLILMFYGDYPTTVTPSQISCGLFIFALFQGECVWWYVWARRRPARVRHISPHTTYRPAPQPPTA